MRADKAEKTDPKTEQDPRLSVGRILHAYADVWDGPRPAVVVGGIDVSVDPPTANFKVMLDDVVDARIAEILNKYNGGPTFGTVPAYKALSEEQRRSTIQEVEPRIIGPEAIRIICEWPPR